MDRDTASDLLRSAERARRAAESPPVPSWVPSAVGLLVGVGFLALGLLPFTVWWRLVALVLALAAWGTAGWLVLYLRACRGVRGLRGHARASAVVLLVCALSLVPGALASNDGMRVPYVVLGIVGGACMWWTTRRQVDHD